MLPNLGIFERIFIEKVFMVLLSSIDLSMSLIISYQNLSLTLPHWPGWHMWSFVGRVKRDLLDSNLLQGQRLDPLVDTYIYGLVKLVHR